MPRTKQPFGLAPLRRQSRLAANLVSCLYSTRRGVAQSAIGALTGDPTLYYTEPTSFYYGSQRYSAPGASTTSYGFAAYIPKTMSANANVVSVACLAKFTTLSSASGLTNTTGGGFASLMINQRQGAGVNEIGCTMRAGSGTYYAAASGITDTTRGHFSVARLRADGPIEIWVDGALKGSTTHARGGFNTFYVAPQLHTTYVQRDANVAVAYAWDRWITDDEILELSEDPFSLLGAEDPLDNVGAVVVTAQYARPATPDGTNTGWLPSSGSDLYAMIDETPSSSADYIYTRDPDAMFEVPLSSVTDPAVGTGHVVRFKAYSPYAQRVRLCLYDGTTLIAEWTDTLTTGEALYEHTLTSGEANSITSGSYAGGLKLRGYGVRP